MTSKMLCYYIYMIVVGKMISILGSVINYLWNSSNGKQTMGLFIVNKGNIMPPMFTVVSWLPVPLV